MVAASPARTADVEGPELGQDAIQVDPVFRARVLAAAGPGSTVVVTPDRLRPEAFDRHRARARGSVNRPPPYIYAWARSERCLGSQDIHGWTSHARDHRSIQRGNDRQVRPHRRGCRFSSTDTGARRTIFPWGRSTFSIIRSCANRWSVSTSSRVYSAIGVRRPG